MADWLAIKRISTENRFDEIIELGFGGTERKFIYRMRAVNRQCAIVQRRLYILPVLELGRMVCVLRRQM